MSCAEEIEFVAPVIIGAGPFGGRVEAVAGEISDAASVVVSFAERVLNLTVEKAGRGAAEGEFEPVAFLVAVGL